MLEIGNALLEVGNAMLEIGNAIHKIAEFTCCIICQTLISF